MRQFHDKRGRMLFNFDEPPFEVKQSITSISQKNVLRGLHISPYQKYIVVVTGHIFDVVVQPDGTYKTYDLKVGNSVLVGENCAHGFYAFEDSQIIYFQSGFHDPTTERACHWNDPVLNIPWPIENKKELIVSDKDSNNPLFNEIDTLILGCDGFIGKELLKYVKNSFGSNVRLDRVEDELRFLKPKRVISAAGISGKPTIAWSEENKDETFDTNFTQQLHLIHVCKKLGIELAIIGSGMVYDGEKYFTEDDLPNYDKMFYCRVRGLLENTIREMYNDDVLYLRLMYPSTNDENPKSFINKIKSRKDNVHDTNVSITFTPSLFPKIQTLFDKNVKGVLNFTNEGSLSLGRLLEICGEEYTISNEKSNRGECKMDVTKLKTYIEVEELSKAIKD